MSTSVVEQKLDDTRAAEKCLLGGILVDNARLTDASDVVRPIDFWRREHRDLFGSMLALAESGKPIDPITLSHQLGSLDSGEHAYIASLTDGVPRASNVRAYAEIVRRHAQERRIETAAARVAALAAKGEITIEARQDLFDALAETPARVTSPLVDDVALSNLPEPAELIAGRAPGSGLAVLIGSPGSGKTFVGTDLGASVATGRPWLGAQVLRRGPVVYVPGEGAGGFKRRLGCWKIAHGILLDDPIGFHTWTDGAVNLLDGLAVSRFIRHVETSISSAPVLFIWDTLARCMVGADENSVQDMGRAIENLDRIAQTFQAVNLVIHHTTKAETVERGSSALRGAADTMLILTKADDELTLKNDKQKDGEPFDDIALRLVPAYEGAPSLVVRLASDVLPSADLTRTQSALMRVLQESFRFTGANHADWLKAAAPVNERSYFRARNELIKLGLVRQDGQLFKLSDSRLTTTDTPLTRRFKGD